MKYATPRIIRGRTNSTILRNIAVLRERYPSQSQAQDMAISLNVAQDVSTRRGQQPRRRGAK
jgi:hypothetical protein